ncbi:MAG: hypothetical protein IR153_09755 [Flavobacterium sp.]|nr:hypothetical protein [Flavobacterium sp.]
MKKIIAILTLFFAFTVSGNAQEKLSNEEQAKVDAYKMSQALNLQGTRQDEFVQLFVKKYQVLNDPKMSDERKKEMNRIVELKVRASLTPEQIAKLDASPELLAKVRGTAAPDTTADLKKK